ncbi:hypothetical protein [Micromonospora globbae]|uniref:Collagen-like protein n=1 Tax=Micromonospora globbae TaxID=1894969 RepID=A0A420F3A9_9ACTN|nr:hypothetical protein [Micromonospora globbae]RKF27410.1 hypothetical protein D7I43_10135 [Micromonospora globbae]
MAGEVGSSEAAGVVGPSGVAGEVGPSGVAGEVGPSGVAGVVGPVEVADAAGPSGLAGAVFAPAGSAVLSGAVGVEATAVPAGWLGIGVAGAGVGGGVGVGVGVGWTVGGAGGWSSMNGRSRSTRAEAGGPASTPGPVGAVPSPGTGAGSPVAAMFSPGAPVAAACGWVAGGCHPDWDGGAQAAAAGDGTQPFGGGSSPVNEG